MLHCYVGVNRAAQSGSGGGVFVAVGAARRGARCAFAHRTRSRFGRCIVRVVEPDRRRQYVERDSLAAAVQTFARIAVAGALRITRRSAARTIADRARRGAFGAGWAVIPLAALGALRAIIALDALRPVVALRAIIAQRAIIALISLRTLLAVVAL
ncbi:MAG: hypothetical protein ABIS38_03250, partial [Sphingomicrobium sp.]